ncbi:hypothetical protein TNCV_1159241 [Trichonephila clavipes]|nr:hypothetical protein TNCV_1159241 [Trichonephila clavipes]
MPSPVQSNCDAHDTIANGQYGAVWSMGHTQQVCVRIVLLPSNDWQQFFGRSAFLRQQETDLPPAELCIAPVWTSIDEDWAHNGRIGKHKSRSIGYHLFYSRASLGIIRDSFTVQWYVGETLRRDTRRKKGVYLSFTDT